MLRQMNKRIKELAEHCDFYVGNEYSNKSHEKQQVIWTEKFAELIIKECVGVIDARGEKYDPTSLIAEWVNVFTTDIKQHFGIKK